MSNIDWSKAPADATHHFAQNDKHVEHWAKDGFFCVTGLEGGGWIPEYSPLPRSAYTARPAASWGGQGLPPAGSEVTVIEGPCSFEGDLINWLNTRVKVASAFKNALGQDILAVENSSGECACFIAECLQPALTAEQIAAEERKRITDDIQRVCVDGENNGVPFHEALYEAGYRKPD